jgi:hypothetical protein
LKVAAQRLFADEEVQNNLRTAAVSARKAIVRARTRRLSKAADDKQLYARVRETATSLTEAVGALRAKPEPKRRGRRLVALVVIAAGTALIVKNLRDSTQPDPAQPVSTQVPAAAPVPPQPVSA